MNFSETTLQELRPVVDRALRFPSTRRLTLFACTWLAIFFVGLAVNLWTPADHWRPLVIGYIVFVRLPIDVLITPAALLVAHYFLVSPRSARRYLLSFLFVLANWNQSRVIVNRKARRAGVKSTGATS